MRFMKWSVLFVAAFIVAWILIFTFTQEPFRVTVSAKILAYQTPAIPVYIYVAGAFAIGLLIGLWVAIYYYIIQSRQLHIKSKKLSATEQELIQKNSELERFQAELENKNEQLLKLNSQSNQYDSNPAQENS